MFIYVMRPLSFALARPVEDASGSSEAVTSHYSTSERLVAETTSFYAANTKLEQHSHLHQAHHRNFQWRILVCVCVSEVHRLQTCQKLPDANFKQRFLLYR